MTREQRIQYDQGERLARLCTLNRLEAAMLIPQSPPQPAGMTPEELRTIRTLLGLAQWEMALQLHCSERTLQRKEAGEVSIHPLEAEKVRALKIEHDAR